MNRSLRSLLLVTAVLALGACPDRHEAIDTVGGAPGRTVEDARVKADAAELKLKKAAEQAAAVGAN